MSLFCGVTSNKFAKNSTLSTNCVCDFKSFQDLERDIETLYEELISLEPDFKLKSEAIQEWQYQEYENSSQLQLLNGMMNMLQRGLEETEYSLRSVTRDLEKLDLILKPIEIVTDKIKCTCNFDSQRYQLYPQFLDCFNEIKSMNSDWLNREEVVEIIKSDTLKQIILYHVRILESIENKINSLEEQQKINDNILKIHLKRVNSCESCSTFPAYI